MKEFWNRYKIELIIFLLLLLFFFLVFIPYQMDQVKLQRLTEQLNASHPELSLVYHKKNAYDLFLEWFRNSPLESLQFLLPLLVGIPGSWWLFQKKRSGFLASLMMREPYPKIMRKEVARAWRSALILPCFFLIVFLTTALYSQNFQIPMNATNIDASFLHVPFFYLLYFTFNLVLISIFFINITLFFVLKNKSYMVAILTSFFSLLGYQIIAELFIGLPLAQATGILNFGNSFTLFNLWVYDSVISLPWMTGYCFTLVIGSILLLFTSYHKKEKVVLAIEA